MNCEKCKNKKATLFYADEGGGRHALCALCGEKQSRITPVSAQTAVIRKETEAQSFIPALSLTAFAMPLSGFDISGGGEGSMSCKTCAMTAKRLFEEGEVGCPDCYTVFAEILFPLLPEADGGDVRMPFARKNRQSIKQQLTDLRASLKEAIEGENYELAATLRDRIRALEGSQIL